MEPLEYFGIIVVGGAKVAYSLNILVVNHGVNFGYVEVFSDAKKVRISEDVFFGVKQVQRVFQILEGVVVM